MSVRRPVYLDNHATTRTDPRVVEAMLPYFTEHYGNAASVSHRFGWEADEAVEHAREQVARAIGAESREIVFTSGATESNNLAIKGLAHAATRRGKHLVTAAAEHKAVLDPMKRLARRGLGGHDRPLRRARPGLGRGGRRGPDRSDRPGLGHGGQQRGRHDQPDRRRSAGSATIAGSSSTPTPPRPSARSRSTSGATRSTCSASRPTRFYGPKGIGALYVRRRDPAGPAPAAVRRRRPRARVPERDASPCRWSSGWARPSSWRSRGSRRNRAGCWTCASGCTRRSRQRVPGIRLNGHPTDRLPGNLNLSFADVDGEALMMAMRDVAVSSGSACSAADPEPSHVLRAMGLSEDLARSSLRFGLGRFTTDEEIDFAADAVADGRRAAPQPGRRLESGVTRRFDDAV